MTNSCRCNGGDLDHIKGCYLYGYTPDGMPRNSTLVPWKVTDNGGIETCDGRWISSHGEGPDKANADFIVKAVNSYHEMLFACKEAADAIYGWDEPDNPVLPLLKKAIKKAGGQNV